MLQVVTLVLGPVATNTYLVADTSTGEAIVIDPAWDGQIITMEAQQRHWHITQTWITHAHFDHFAGVNTLRSGSNPPVSIALHPADLPLWHMKGGAEWFGIQIDVKSQPEKTLQHGQILQVGQFKFEVRHTPGHSPGHVIFFCATEGMVFCGDTIFAGGIGRTDLPGGDEETLIRSIRKQILTLPDNTRLLCGHGLETMVGIERKTNLFLV